MKPIAIIADDLTGANDTGAQLCMNGFQTLVLTEVSHLDGVGDSQQVLSIDAETRNLTAVEAYRCTRELTFKLKNKGIHKIYKKMDSTLRGHPGAELDAVMDAWQSKQALVVLSLPSNGRFVQNGFLQLEHEPESSTMLAYRSKNEWETVCHIATLLKKEMQHRVKEVHLSSVRQGPRFLAQELDSAKQEADVLVVDAVSEDDLATIAKAVGALEEDRNLILSGSAGFAAYLGLAWDLKGSRLSDLVCLNRQGVSLIVVGSQNPVTLSQVKKLLSVIPCQVLTVDADAVLLGQRTAEIQRVLQEAAKYHVNDGYLIVTVKGPLKEHIADNSLCTADKDVAAALGEIAGHLVNMFPIKALVATGGETAIHICRTLKSWGIQLVTDLLPGIPLGCLEGGYSAGLPIITKAGGFGTSNALVEILEFIHDKSICQKELLRND